MFKETKIISVNLVVNKMKSVNVITFFKNNYLDFCFLIKEQAYPFKVQQISLNISDN